MPIEDRDFCRVCRCEATASQPLFHPCMCTGSIKYVHQECLVKWLQYSRRQTCELCNHRFTFKPVYAPHTPTVVPLRVLFLGLATALRNVLNWIIHFTTVLISWFFVVPLTVCRIYRCFFSGNVTAVLSLPLDVISMKNFIQDCMQGLLIVTIALSAFLGYVWLREQLVAVGDPDWLTNVFEDAANEEEQGATVPPDPVTAAPTAPDDNHPPPPENNDPEGVAAAPVEQQLNNQAVAPAGLPLGLNDVEFDAGGPDVVPPMTLERIFGLDGTLTFLEHVLWVIVLNIFFILIFASFPFFAGRTVLSAFNINTVVLTPPIEGILFSFMGYVVIAGFLMMFHCLFKSFRRTRYASYCAGTFYIYIKVSVIAFVEFGIFTAFCGLWIDACSLNMFNVSIAQRLRAFNQAPLLFLFKHWTMGMLYLFYTSSLVLLIRDVVRPGVLWFLPDFADPDYKPIQEMISVPMWTYLQRLIMNLSTTGITVMLSLWLPTRITQKLLPGFLPFQFSVTYDSPVDYSVEIIALQIVTPYLLDGQLKIFLSAILRKWCLRTASILGIRSYLLGDVAFKPGDVIVMANGREIPATVTDDHDDDDGAEANPVGEDEEEEGFRPPPPTDGFTPYVRPRFFALRLIGLLGVIVVSLVAISWSLLVVPVALGRHLMVDWGFDQKPHDALTLFVGMCGISGCVKIVLYLPVVWQSLRDTLSASLNWTKNLACWLMEQCIEGLRLLRGNPFAVGSWTGRNTPSLALVQVVNSQEDTGGYTDEELREAFRTLMQNLGVPLRLALLILVLLVILPASLGLLINLVIFIPMWIDTEKTMVVGFAENWIFGVMHLKVWMLILLVGPRWCVRDLLEEFHDEILQNWPVVQVSRILRLSAPLFVAIGLILSVPFLLVYYISPILSVPQELALRYIYPSLFALAVVGCSLGLQMQQCVSLYMQIKDAEYLIGRRLVNYGDAGVVRASADMGTQTEGRGLTDHLV